MYAVADVRRVFHYRVSAREGHQRCAGLTEFLDEGDGAGRVVLSDPAADTLEVRGSFGSKYQLHERAAMPS